MKKLLFTLLTLLFLSAPLAAQVPAGVYFLENPDEPFIYYYLSILELGSRPDAILCAEGSANAPGYFGFEYEASIQAAKTGGDFTLTLRLVKNIKTPKKFLPPPQLTLTLNEKERALTIRNKKHALKTLAPRSFVYFEAMLDWIKDDIIMVNADRDKREYYDFHPVGDDLQVFTFTKAKQDRVALGAHNRRVTLNGDVDSAYANDLLSFRMDLAFPDKTSRQIEFDIERHPMSWLGARLHVAGKKPLRLWHFEPIQEYYLNGNRNAGEKMFGYRIDTTEEMRYWSPEYPGGIFLNVDWEKNEIFSADRKFVIRMKVENDFNTLILRFPDGKEKVFMNEQ
ncbi:MAG: hypothetical protein EPN93_12560 [Spirochaetes bacterium]|nr:MAG: hypothetical protein EPN93_12560 [Spirochaetota bacterium]